MRQRGLFVTGTGTEVGKSIVAAACIANLAVRGERVAAFKPAISGLDEAAGVWPPDHELLATATGWQDPQSVSPHRFGPAVSPHLAAEQAGRSIALEDLLAAYRDVSGSAERVIVEGVGGLLVPLATQPELSVLDFAKAIALPVVVATHPGLGTISDTRLTVDRLAAEGLDVRAVVISGWPERPSELQSSNLSTLRDLLPVEVATLAHTTPDQLASAAANLPLERWLADSQ